MAMRSGVFGGLRFTRVALATTQRAIPALSCDALGLAARSRKRVYGVIHQDSESISAVFAAAVQRQGAGPARSKLQSMTLVCASRVGSAFAGRSMSMTVEEYNKRVNDVNAQFAEARLLIEDALDSQGTTYFEDDLADAQEAVKETLQAFTNLLKGLDEQKRGETQRSMGMKMEQLKGELGQILDSLTNDEELPPAKGKE